MRSQSIQFPKMFNINTGAAQVIYDYASENSCMKGILLSSIGELFGDPLFGSNLKSYMFELNSKLYLFQLEDEIKQSLKKHMPRVHVDRVEINSSEYDKNKLTIKIYYQNVDSDYSDVTEISVTPEGEIQ